MIPVVYIAAPYSAANAWWREANIRHAEWLALQVWQKGAVGLCVHTMCRFYQGLLPEDTWLRGDLALIERCDAMLMGVGWEESAGSQAERSHAHTRGIPVFETLTDLETWLTGRAQELDRQAGLPL